jgi:hypothetical protein
MQEELRDMWKEHFSKNAADLLQVQRQFAGEDVFQRLLFACFKRRMRSMKINERTVLAVLDADTEEQKRA